jgi:hypothetical protein
MVLDGAHPQMANLPTRGRPPDNLDIIQKNRPLALRRRPKNAYMKFNELNQ